MIYSININGTSIGQIPLNNVAQLYEIRRDKSLSLFKQIRYGSNDASTQPFQSLHNTIQAYNKLRVCNFLHIPGEMFRDPRIYSCFDADTLFAFFPQTLQQSYEIYNNFDPQPDQIPLTETLVECMWDILYFLLYNEILYPSFFSCLDDIHSYILSSVESIKNGSIILLVAAFCFSFFDFMLSREKQKEYKFSMSLFLHYPPSVILQSPLIVQILNGDFRSKRMLTFTDGHVFKQVKDQLPNSIIIADFEGKIISINKSAFHLFDGKNFRTMNEMFNWIRFNGTAQQILIPGTKTTRAIIKNEIHC
jgi:hypothetical protein